MAITDSSSTLLDRWALSLLTEDPELLELARRVTDATGCPVLGGIAVFLHGYRRTTEDIDLHSSDTKATQAALEDLGAVWDSRDREYRLDGVPVHVVTDEQTGGPPTKVSEIRGVKVVSLADLIRFKLHSGLDRPERSQDIADVVELIKRVPLDKAFVTRLPKQQRNAFRKLVDAVRGGD